MKTRKISEEQANEMINIIIKGKLFKKPEDIKAAWAKAGFIQSKTEPVEVDLSDKTFLILARAAHEKDITFNEFCEETVKEVLGRLKTNEDNK